MRAFSGVEGVGADARPGGVRGGCQDLSKASRLACLCFAWWGLGLCGTSPYEFPTQGPPAQAAGRSGPGLRCAGRVSQMLMIGVPGVRSLGEPPVSLQPGQALVGVWCWVHSAGTDGQGKVVCGACLSPRPGEGPPQGTSLK